MVVARPLRLASPNSHCVFIVRNEQQHSRCPWRPPHIVSLIYVVQRVLYVGIVCSIAELHTRLHKMMYGMYVKRRDFQRHVIVRVARRAKPHYVSAECVADGQAWLHLATTVTDDSHCAAGLPHSIPETLDHTSHRCLLPEMSSWWSPNR